MGKHFKSMAGYCKEEGIIFDCIFGGRERPYTAGRKFQAGIDSNNYSKVQGQKIPEAAGQLLLELFQEEVR